MPKFVGAVVPVVSKEDAYMSALFNTVLIDAGKTLEDAAEESGLAIQTLSRLSNGLVIPEGDIEQVRRWIEGVSMNRLYYDKPDIRLNARRIFRHASWFVIDHPIVTLAALLFVALVTGLVLRIFT